MVTKKRRTPRKARAAITSTAQPRGKREAAPGTPKASQIIERVKTSALMALSARQRAESNLWLSHEPLAKGSTIYAHRQAIEIDRPSVMVFADHHPQANWAHACRYMLFDARSGERYRTVQARFPPSITDDSPSLEAFHQPKRFDYELLPFRYPKWLYCPLRKPKGQRYAVLFSGASNNRHVNDMEFLYRTLRDLYAFPADNIYVLNYDGTVNYAGNPKPVTAWPGDGTAYRMPIDGSGTKAELEGVLDELKARLKRDDMLLIHTNNHGGWDGWGQAYLCAYSGADYYAADFGAKLAELPRFHCLMVMMEQCHSGGFNQTVIDNSPADHVSIASACEEDQNSIGGAHFDPFARDWIAAMTGSDPYGAALSYNPDANASGRVSAREAFDYADAVHDPYDTPVYDSSSTIADSCHLGRRYVWWWLWWCPLVHEVLWPYFEKLPEPVFYDRLHSQLAPLLEPIADRLEKDAEMPRKQVEALVRNAVGRAFG